MDFEYLLWLQDLRPSLPQVLQRLFEVLGSESIMVAMALLPCLIYWCIDKKSGMLGFVSYGMSSIFNTLVKSTVCCYRPWVRDARVKPVPSAIKAASGYSFPSGHSQSAASVTGGLSYHHRDKGWPMALAVVFTLLIAFSRNLLGVHTPQDVIVGMLEGFAFVIICARLIDWVEQEEGRDKKMVLVGVACAVALLAYTMLKPYPEDYVNGVLLVDPLGMKVDACKTIGIFLACLFGYYGERHYVDFKTEGITFIQGLARFFVGIAIVLLLYVPIGHALVNLLGDYPGQLIRTFLTFFMAACGIPALFGPLDKLFVKGL
ncbi:MAG: phosphatase PAP2 family protein [Atopobiaceae bacterium]|nr:phosphatase PAP2 family protein [Atopobiaceae bacterium]